MATVAAAASRPQDVAGRRRAREHPLVWLVFLACAVLVWWGARTDLSDYLYPEEGLGYALGIIGASMMLALLVYPLHKRVRALRRLGSASGWFRVHMLLGVLGPVCILFHAGFRLGSLNSAVAMTCMLVVAGSGLVGRYLYSRIHHGLYGARLSAASLADEARAAQQRLEALLDSHSPVLAELGRAAALWDESPRRLGGQLALALRAGAMAGRLRRALGTAAPGAAGSGAAEAGEVAALVTAYAQALRRAAGLRLFERLFSWWHVLHVPLFVMLVISAVVHVIAVHVF